MAVAASQGCHRIGGLHERPGRRLAPQAAEDGVDEPGGALAAAFARQLHRGAHRGVRGDAVELEELVGAEPEEVAEGWCHRLPSEAGEERQPVVEGILGAEHAAGQLVGQPAVGVGQGGDGGREGGVEGPAAAHLP